LLAETDTGYAALCGSCVLFLDEDGALQGEAPAQEKVLDLLPAEGGVLALMQDPERGRKQAVFALISPQTTPEPGEEHTPAPAAAAHEGIFLGDGYLRCIDGGYSGVTVSRIDGMGSALWQTRIPIHTAADRLVLETAQIMQDGDIYLTGYYETQTAGGVLREGARAVLSADGVLKEIALTE